MIRAYFLGTFLGPTSPNFDQICEQALVYVYLHVKSDKFGWFGPRKVPKK